MSRVTAKLQVTIPKAVAEAYRIEPGSEIQFQPNGEFIRVSVAALAEPASIEDRLAWFDQATARQRRRQKKAPSPRGPRSRGWSREDLYHRGRTG